MATYQFGTVGETNLEEDTYGLLQSFSTNKTADEAVAQNAEGNVADQHIYNKVTEITAEYILDTDKTLPVQGDTIVVGGTDKYSVMSIAEPESNTDYKKGQITLKRYTSVGVPTNS